MSEDDEQSGDLPDQWWMLALVVWAPCFLYFWLAKGEQFKGSVIGGVLGGIVIACGFYLPRFRSLLFWMVAALIAIVQVVPLSLLDIPNYRGASFGVLLPLVLSEVGLTYFAIRYAFSAFERSID